MSDTGIRVETPRPLLEAARNRTLVLFIGAGFSRNISPNIPDASKLISIAAEHARIDERLLATHASNDYMLVAEYLQIERSLDAAIAALASSIHDKAFAVEFSRPHLQLTEIDCSSIFTTNWDSWIERAFEYNRVPHRVIRNAADLVSPTKGKAYAPRATVKSTRKTTYPEVSIIKFHGDLQDPRSIVFSIRSYFDRIMERNAVDALLETELFGKSFLFVGYSFTDPNLRLIWYKLLRQRELVRNVNPAVEFPPSFLVTIGNNPVFAKWLAHLGIIPISVDPTPAKLKESVVKVLDEIIGAQS